jgi:hypothetical protein
MIMRRESLRSVTYVKTMEPRSSMTLLKIAALLLATLFFLKLLPCIFRHHLLLYHHSLFLEVSFVLVVSLEFFLSPDFVFSPQ